MAVGPSFAVVIVAVAIGPLVADAVQHEFQRFVSPLGSTGHKQQFS